MKIIISIIVIFNILFIYSLLKICKIANEKEENYKRHHKK